MTAVIEAARANSATAVRERLEEFGQEVLAEATNRPRQMANGGLYLRGLLEDGKRKSLEPMVSRLGGEFDYQSMQQFLTDSPWDPALVVRAVAERVCPEIEVEAWALDDTGFPKQGKRSPGVKRQYSGTLGKTGNCQVGAGARGRLRGNGAPGLGAVPPRGVVLRRRAAAPGEDPRGGHLQDQVRARRRAPRARRRLEGAEGAGAGRRRLRREHRVV